MMWIYTHAQPHTPPHPQPPPPTHTNLKFIFATIKMYSSFSGSEISRHKKRVRIWSIDAKITFCSKSFFLHIAITLFAHLELQLDANNPSNSLSNVIKWSFMKVGTHFDDGQIKIKIKIFSCMLYRMYRVLSCANLVVRSEYHFKLF